MKNELISFYQPALVGYRKEFFKKVIDVGKRRICVLYGSTATASSVYSEHNEEPWSVKIDNIWLCWRKLLWQTGSCKISIVDGILVLNLNPRFLHNWFILIVRQMLGRKTLVWGHLFSRGGKGKFSNSLRMLQMLISDGVILYTESELVELRKLGIKKNATFLGNSCVLRSEIFSHKNSPNARNCIIYVGRLNSQKRPDLLFEAYLKLYGEFPEMRLIVIGGGEEETILREKYAYYISIGLIEMPGWIWESNALREYYERSLFSVTSGYVGLNVIQSFAYGVPTIVANGEPHAPEIEACIDGQNSKFFPKGNVQALVGCMRSFVENREDWESKRQNIADFVKRNYTIDDMVMRFLAFVDVIENE